MARGLLSLFRAGRPQPVTQRQLERLITDGWVTVNDRGGHRLTQKGIDYVEQELFPQLGVTPAEVAAWIREHEDDAFEDWRSRHGEGGTLNRG
jgi:hypothetical protein